MMKAVVKEKEKLLSFIWASYSHFCHIIFNTQCINIINWWYQDTNLDFNIVIETLIDFDVILMRNDFTLFIFSKIIVS